MRPVSHQRGKQVVDQVRGRTVHPLPYQIGGHVRPRGRRRGGAGQGPADLVWGQGEAFPEREQDIVEKPDWFTGEEMIEEGPVELRRSGGTRKLRESGGGKADGQLLGRPYSLGGCRSEAGGPVISLCLLDGLEIG